MGFPRLLPALAVLAVGLASCSKPKETKPEVILLHSGRLRGNVYPASLQSISPLQYYPFLAGYIRRVREQAEATGAKVFVVDLGDSLSGSFASQVTGSRNMTEFFNAVGYDAVLLSNLDAAVPESAIRSLRCQVLCPFWSKASAPLLPPAGAKIEKGGLPLYLLANFYGDTSPESQPGRFPEMFQGVAVVPVRDYAGVLQGLGTRPQGALTALAWMKFEPASQPPESLLAGLRKLGVDAILAHRIYGNKEREAWQSDAFVDWAPPVSLNILRNNGGFTLARLDLARIGGGWKVLRHELVPMTANEAPADPKIVAEIEAFAPAILAADSPIAPLPQPVPPERVLEIYLAALAGLPGTGAVVYSPDSIRSGWRACTLRASEVFNSLPWESGLVQINLSPEQLESLAGSKNLVVLRKTGAGGEVTVTTSRYFSQRIAAQLYLDSRSLHDLPPPGEFDFFLRFLKENPDAISRGLPEGWSLVNRP